MLLCKRVFIVQYGDKQTLAPNRIKIVWVWDCVCFRCLTVESEWACHYQQVKTTPHDAGHLGSGKEHSGETNSGPILLLTSLGQQRKVGEDQNELVEKLYPFPWASFLDAQVSTHFAPLVSGTELSGLWWGLGEGEIVCAKSFGQCPSLILCSLNECALTSCSHTLSLCHEDHLQQLDLH